MAREPGEGEPTSNDVPGTWTDVTGIADVWANASVAHFSMPVFDEGCMPSELG